MVGRVGRLGRWEESEEVEGRVIVEAGQDRHDEQLLDFVFFCVPQSDLQI